MNGAKISPQIDQYFSFKCLPGTAWPNETMFHLITMFQYFSLTCEIREQGNTLLCDNECHCYQRRYGVRNSKKRIREPYITIYYPLTTKAQCAQVACHSLMIEASEGKSISVAWSQFTAQQRQLSPLIGLIYKLWHAPQITRAPFVQLPEKTACFPEKPPNTIKIFFRIF